MSISDQGTVVVLLTGALFLGCIVTAVIRGWPFRAGLASLFVTFIPLAWQVTMTDSDSPAGAFALLLTPISVLLMAVGALMAAVRGLRRLLSPSTTNTTLSSSSAAPAPARPES